MNRALLLGSALLLAAGANSLLAPSLAFAQAAPTTLPPEARLPIAEEQVTLKLPPAGPHRVYVHDTVFPHGKDGHVWVLDGDKLEVLGQLPAANWANFRISPDHKTLYISETHWHHGNRGPRDDIVAVYDAETLELTKEITLRDGRFIIVDKKQNLDTSPDGKFLYVYNLDPASSVEIIDTAKQEHVGTVEIPGCALIFPHKDNRFSALCSDGSLATVTHDANGVGQVEHSTAFHDAEKDPVFEHSAFDKYAGEAYFISYTGKIYPVKFGAKPQFGAAWSLQTVAGVEEATTSPQQTAWRPGGWQLSAYHRQQKLLYVLMHEGKFWTHKNSGTEVWVVDVVNKKLINRLKLKEPTQSIAVSQDDSVQLYAISETLNFQVYDPRSGNLLGQIEKLGDSPQVFSNFGD